MTVEEQQLEEVDDTKYLGVMISGDGSMQQEVEARTGAVATWRYFRQVSRSAGEEKAQQADKAKGGECDNDASANVWM